MALKPDRQIDAVDISYFLNEAADDGVIVCVSTSGSGVAMESTSNLATVAGASSGNKPLGMLLSKFVAVDETRYQTNVHKDEQDVGDKAAIMTKGWAVTNKVAGSPTAGQFAILASSGSVTGVSEGTTTWNQAANPKIGRFRTKPDQYGYAKVYVDL